MSIEKRMQDFQKVSDKNFAPEDVSKRMEDFDKVKESVQPQKEDKTGNLPYGFKRYRPCPKCSEIMEIQELIADKATYVCGSCHEIFKLTIDS